MNVRLSNFLFYFLKLGTTRFGGPVVLVNAMQEDLVEHKKWVTDEEFQQGLALVKFCPGPLATQLAIFLGWQRFGIAGATMSGIGLLFPSFVIVALIAEGYRHYGDLTFIRQLLYGMGASIIGCVAFSGYKLVTRTFEKDLLQWIVGTLGFLAVAFTHAEPVAILLASGLAYAFVKEFSRSGFRSILIDQFFYYFKVGAFVFGGGFAIVPFLQHGVVDEFHWVTNRQFLDAMSVSMITPGPILVAVVFIGFLTSGLMGSLVSIVAIVLPCFLCVVLLAPFFTKIATIRPVALIVEGITISAIGIIAGSAVILGRNAIVDYTTAIFCVTTFLVLVFFRKIPEPIVILTCAAMGFVLHD